MGWEGATCILSFTKYWRSLKYKWSSGLHFEKHWSTKFVSCLLNHGELFKAGTISILLSLKCNIHALPWKCYKNADSDSVGLGWSLRCCASKKVLSMLLVCGPHAEWQWQAFTSHITPGQGLVSQSCLRNSLYNSYIDHLSFIHLYTLMQCIIS